MSEHATLKKKRRMRISLLVDSDDPLFVDMPECHELCEFESSYSPQEMLGKLSKRLTGIQRECALDELARAEADEGIYWRIPCGCSKGCEKCAGRGWIDTREKGR